MAECSYAGGTPIFPLQGMTIGDMLDSTAAEYPADEAVVSVYQEIRRTYCELSGQADTVARFTSDPSAISRRA
jgi:fatty-acyl-CoA synthase